MNEERELTGWMLRCNDCSATVELERRAGFDRGYKFVPETAGWWYSDTTGWVCPVCCGVPS